MPRDNIKASSMKKLEQFFTKTLDTNNDGLVNWTDFEAAIEVSRVDQQKKNLQESFHFPFLFCLSSRSSRKMKPQKMHD